jgi:SAM-dependent methyltransferase
MKGYLDDVTFSSVRGWAVDSDGRGPNLVAYINGTAAAYFQPSLHRGDLVGFDCKELGFDVRLDRFIEIGDVVSVTNLSGEHLTGSPKRIKKLHATREDRALALVTRDMKILEIGPSYSPLAARSQGWNSFSLDHATQEVLRAKYLGQQHVERIEPVDYLWKGGAIETAVPLADHGTFDVVIASHVIEHIPDPIGFFLSAGALLKENGLISLVVPDKRLMFDFFKPVTVTSDYLCAHYYHRTRHSKKTAFDNAAFNVRENGEIVWSARLVSKFELFPDDPLLYAKQLFDQTSEDESSPYVDFHATVYTLTSFELIMLDLAQMGVLPFTIARTFPTNGCEFYVSLRKGLPAKMDREALKEARLRLMKGMVRELGQQASWLLDDDLAPNG